MITRILAVALVAILAGCTGATFRDNQEGQSGQGKDRATAEYAVGPGGEIYLENLTVDIGRDKENVEVTVTHPNGLSVTYSAAGATGLEQARIRAEVERKVAEVQGEITPDIVRGILDSVLGR